MRRTTQEEFINKVSEVHGDRYDISATVYTTNIADVVVVCKEHGAFTVRAAKFIGGGGCALCGRKYSQDKKRSTTEAFVQKAMEVHGDKYDYSKAKYGKDNTDKVTITCKEHGDFQQAPDKHIRGRGCPSCANNRVSAAMRAAPNGWSHTTWEAKGKVSPNFEGFSVYLIRCSGNGETFVKVGKTFTSVAKRFNCELSMPYKFSVLSQVYYNAYAISKLEEKIHAAMKEHKYTPSRAFGGQHECYSIEAVDAILEMLHK